MPGLLLLNAVAIVAAAGCKPREPDSPSGTVHTQKTERHVRGVVLSEGTPVAGARVRRQGHTEYVLSDADGQFSLPLDESDTAIAAWKSGYFIGLSGASRDGATIQLRPLPREDCPTYKWVSPHPEPGSEQRCGNCHREIYDEWQGGSHGRAATNRRFLSLYGGFDWSGSEEVGWSLLADHPLGAGVCASCHVPSLERGEPGADDLRAVTGVASQGVHCDFCHKIESLPTADERLSHGRLAVNLLRPAEGQLFFGPLEDATRGEETYSPVLRDSRLCASCHEGVVFGVHVYSTYSEWLASPARQRGQTCQSCHMKPTGNMHNVAPLAGGIERDPRQLASHNLLPGGKASMLRSSLQLRGTWNVDAEERKLSLQLAATNVGHRVPTGFVDRHLILCVDPVDRQALAEPTGSGPSTPAPQRVRGPKLPEVVGSGLGGRAGLMFGRSLTDVDGNTPSPFWRVIAQASDTRLRPQIPVSASFEVLGGAESVRVRILYRRFWESVRLEKQWPDDTLTIYDMTVRVGEDFELPKEDRLSERKDDLNPR